MKVICSLNEKGGCGKTFLVVNLAEYLAAQGEKVLITDMDPQGNATAFYADSDENCNFNSYQTVVKKADEAIAKGDENALTVLEDWLDIMEEDVDIAAVLNVPNVIRSAIKKTKNENIDIIPGTLHLEAVENSLQSAMCPGSTDAFERLDRAFKRVRSNYDYVLIDCPPRIGTLVYNAIYASDEVIIPLEPNKESLSGLVNVVQTGINLINKVRETPVKFKVLLNKVKDRNYDNQYIEVVRHAFPNNTFKSMVGMSQAKAVNEAGFKHMAVVLDEKLNIAKDIIKLANEILSEEEECHD